MPSRDTHTVDINFNILHDRNILQHHNFVRYKVLRIMQEF